MQADGGLLVNCVRPGTWLLRCDGAGKVAEHIKLDRDQDAVLLSGHTVPSPDGATLYTTEINYRTGRGHIGVRDAATLRKQAEWDSGGIDPHQPVLDTQGHLLVANGGVLRNLADAKYDLQRMESALVRVDTRTGRIAQRWVLDLSIEEDMTPSRDFKMPVADVPPGAGHVVVTIEYQIDPVRADDFRALMQESRRSRLRQGALDWALLRDIGNPGRYIEQISDESWTEHLRRFDRVTTSDVALRERKLAFHVGDAPPLVNRCLVEGS